MGIRAHSNAPLPGNLLLPDPRVSGGHTLVDVGSEFFTDGKAHPMIDSSCRRERILTELKNPHVAVLLLDFILGYDASPDPVGDLMEAIRYARRKNVGVVASVCGTEADPQGWHKQTKALEEAGVIVMPSADEAARLCGNVILAQG